MKILRMPQDINPVFPQLAGLLAIQLFTGFMSMHSIHDMANGISHCALSNVQSSSLCNVSKLFPGYVYHKIAGTVQNGFTEFALMY